MKHINSRLALLFSWVLGMPQQQLAAAPPQLDRNPPKTVTVKTSGNILDEIYVVYRKWKLWWDLFVDSEEDELSALVREHNSKGYRMAQGKALSSNYNLEVLQTDAVTISMASAPGC
jgi:hypothetical protein